MESYHTKAIKMLTLYRRHNQKDSENPCKVYKLGLNPKQAAAYTACDCPIWMKGSTPTEAYVQRSTSTRDWKAAEAILRAEDSSGKDAVVHGPTLADCFQKYLDSRTRDIGGKTHKAYIVLLKRLQEHADAKNRSFIQELDPDFLSDFRDYALGPIYKKNTSLSTAINKLRCFLKEAYRRRWILEPLALDVKPVAAVYEKKQPYTDKEIALILDAAEKLNGGTVGYATDGHRFRLLIEFMLRTGLRVSDAIRYNPANCTRSKLLWIYKFIPQKTKKTVKGKSVECYLRDELKAAIDDCKWMSQKYPFAYRAITKESGDYMATEVYERMQSIGKTCGVEDCRPHRLRDTFAVNLLLAGVPIEEVSRLLHHSSVRVTEDYYAPWIPERTARMERLLFEVMQNADKH